MFLLFSPQGEWDFGGGFYRRLHVGEPRSEDLYFKIFTTGLPTLVIVNSKQTVKVQKQKLQTPLSGDLFLSVLYPIVW